MVLCFCVEQVPGGAVTGASLGFCSVLWAFVIFRHLIHSGGTVRTAPDTVGSTFPGDSDARTRRSRDWSIVAQTARESKLGCKRLLSEN